jgi:hypothetical protein
MKFIPVALLDLGGSPRQFGLAPSPVVLAGMFLLLLEEPEGFLGAKLGNAGKIFDAKAIKHLGALQLAFAQAQRAFDSLGRNGWFGGHRCGILHLLASLVPNAK